MARSPAIGSSFVCLSAAGSVLALGILALAGCRSAPQPSLRADCGSGLCTASLQQIETPDLRDQGCGDPDDASGFYSGPPLTVSTFSEMETFDLSLEDAVWMALNNGKVMQRLGGAVVNNPQGVSTTLDQALNETNPLGGPEAALAAFDAQVATSLNYNHSERKFNNVFFGGGAPTLTSNGAVFQSELAKQTALGTRFAIRNLTDYNRNNSPFNRFPSVWDTVNQFEIRQPLLRGAGAQVNRIAGPGLQPGVYNGVMIARIRSDISLADFEASLHDLIRSVEQNYWELYFAWRDLDTKIAARDAARETWENRQVRFEKGVGRPDEEAQARQQYFSFEAQVQNALTGPASGNAGLLGAERNLRRLVGLPVSDGRIIRPVTEPVVAPTVFDWQALQEAAIQQRVELRRQKWTIKQRELELLAARQLNRWNLDMVGQYGFRGFGDNLFGSRSRPEGSAVADLWTGQLDDYTVGFEYGGPIGRRQGHLAVRNAELQLCREQTVLREQQRQILHDLGAAYTEVDRALVGIGTSYNIRVAALEELEPKRLRVEEGKDQVFFLLDAQQRTATAESGFYRAVIDYNLALTDLTWTTGDMLRQYHVVVEEAAWSGDAQTLAETKTARFELQGDDQPMVCPPNVSEGPWGQ